MLSLSCFNSFIHPLCVDLVPYLTVHEEFQGPLKPNKGKSSVHGETDKEDSEETEDREETGEDREAPTFTNVTSLKKGRSEVQKPNGNHSLHFGMMKNGTHTIIVYSTVHK